MKPTLPKLSDFPRPGKFDSLLVFTLGDDKLSIAVWSPRLKAKGNSYRGMKVLELSATKTDASIF
jgi:glutaminase